MFILCMGFIFNSYKKSVKENPKKHLKLLGKTFIPGSLAKDNYDGFKNVFENDAEQKKKPNYVKYYYKGIGVLAGIGTAAVMYYSLYQTLQTGDFSKSSGFFAMVGVRYVANVLNGVSVENLVSDLEKEVEKEMNTETA
jgi:hypothetical protein